MNRENIYFITENDPKTYDYDDELPALPLPDLNETMQRYYESIKPFGNAEELANSLQVIKNFENGVGAELHEKLKERAGKMKNWLENWWDSYAYHTLRFPLLPYTVMAMALRLDVIDIPETPASLLKNLSRIMYHTLQFWNLVRKAELKGLSTNGGKVKYSSTLYKYFFSTTRVPGKEMDRVVKHFKTVSEGPTPTHCLISGKGRLFAIECLDEDGTLITPQEILLVLQHIRCLLDDEPIGDCVPILTHDDRTSWAINRRKLSELSQNNRLYLKLTESSNIVFVLDEHEPKDYDEVAHLSINGDYHSIWGDRSSIFVGYKNGKFACIGEHSAYDGTISMSYAFFIQLSLFEEPEPEWLDFKRKPFFQLRELKFDLNDELREEIQRMLKQCDKTRTDVIISYTPFDDYGKDFMKNSKLHPDSFIQVIIQLTYARLHSRVVPIYETALMRHYYRGRTETLRSCTSEVYKFLQISLNSKSKKSDIVKSFRAAVEHHNFLMNEARKGQGIDRHLFGLWCIAYENGQEVPDFYNDPLYEKSGGGGNFILSTSTLGYTANVGFVAPMVIDGYGVFYSITSETLHVATSVYRQSEITSARKFNEEFKQTLRWIRNLLETTQHAKL